MASDKGQERATKTAEKKKTSSGLDEYQRKRDFSKTAEPSGHEPVQRLGKLRFVIQKHDATQLHFDLRLEMDDVMKSWAVPKGPSANPTVKRLAMQVEDHPISYNSFEGTIPKGEYGGGTVMLWDTGTYTPDLSPSPSDDEQTAREGYARGDFKITFFGKRIKGSYALVRTRGWPGRSSSKPSWLLIKHNDDFSRGTSDPDLIDEYTTSVTTGRTMKEIAQGK